METTAIPTDPEAVHNEEPSDSPALTLKPVPDDSNEAPTESDVDPEVTAALTKLRIAEEDLRNTAEDDEHRWYNTLTFASAQCDYLVAQQSEDEGAFIEALELVAAVDGKLPRGSPSEITAVDVQMRICSATYEALKDPQWLRQAIEFGKESVKMYKAIRSPDTHWDASQYMEQYSSACEQLAQGYKKLHGLDNNLQTLRAAMIWQGEAFQWAVPATDTEDPPPDEWTPECTRFLEWVDLVIKNVGEPPDLSDVQAIEYTNRVYPYLIDLIKQRFPAKWGGSSMEKHCAEQLLFLTCRQWALTKDVTWFNTVIEQGRDFLAWSLMLEKLQTVLDPPTEMMLQFRERDYSLPMTSLMFFHVHDLLNKEGEWSKHLPTINTSIAMLEEVHQWFSSEVSTIDDLAERRDVLAYLLHMYEEKYEMTNNVADGRRFDDLSFEACMWCATMRSIQLHKEEVVEIPEEPRYRPWSTSIVTESSPMAKSAARVWTTPGKISLDWTSTRLKFKCDEQAPPKMPTVEDWISGRTDDGQWIFGAAVEGRDDDVLEFIKNFTPEQMEAQTMNIVLREKTGDIYLELASKSDPVEQ